MAEAAALAVTGRVVSPLISKLVLKGLSMFKDGMKGKLEHLQTITLPQIKQVIEKAEMLGREDDDKQLMMVWLRELQDAAYEADNVIDEYDYQLLKRQAKGKFKQAVVSPPLSFVSNASFRSKLKDSLEKLDKIASRVHKFTKMLGGVSIDASSLDDDETKFVTGSVPTERRILGRDAERDHILDLLINNHVVASHDESDHEIRDVLVLPIVGVGGVGKTALAQDIYNNPKISEHFQQKMWIHTPQNFDEFMITKRMVESVRQGACPAIDNIDTLQQILLQGLHEKRFLLVLDDVWYDEKQSEYVNRERWRKLLAPLRHGGQGSMVLITSRTNLVAMTLGRNSMQPITLEGLNEHDCLSLFNSYAFEDAAAACGQQRPDDQNDHACLMEIGRAIARKIVSKLGGLPLAAKVLGGMLRNKHDVEEWNKVLRIDIWDDITRVLALSYKRLPPLLRQCVAHHGLYPKGLSFSGNNLVRAWIAEGFIPAAQYDEQQESGGQSMEEIGSNCLNELVFRSFLQRTHDGSFLLHDLIHDVADSVSRHECSRILKGEKKDIRPTTKHLCIHEEDLDEYKENICRLRNLHTLFLLCNSISKFTLDHGVLHSILNKSKRLRTLDLAGCHIDKLPDSIGDLKHLRFLDLSGCTVKTLPKSFHRLYHLLYLDLSKCNFDSVPEDLSELVNLRYLEADATILSMIPNLGRLTALQELKEFHVKKKKKGHEAGQLKNLANLRGTLRIVNLENISSTSEANEAKLHEKTHLREVWLEWDNRNTTSNYSDSAEMVLDGLQPPPHITFLGVKGYVGSRAPIWMQPNNLLCGSSLHTLILGNCVKLQSLPPLGRLFPHLRELRLNYCNLIRYLPYLPPNLITLVLFHPQSLALLTEEELKISTTTDGPQLELTQEVLLEKSEFFKGDSVTDSLEQNQYRIVNVEEIMSWLEIGINPLVHKASESVLSNIINKVSSLKVGGIQEKLKMMKLDAGNVQQLPSSLQHLHLSGISVDGPTLSQCLSRLHSLAYLELYLCMCIISFPSREVLSNLRRLKEVLIFRCKMLLSLGGLASLTSLEKLTIRECPNLMIVVPSDDDSHDQSSGGALLPESLTDLSIIDCGFLDTYMGRCLMGLTRLSHLTLANCQNMTSLPPAEELMQLTSLKNLRIVECELLVSVGGLHVLLSSLRNLGVFKCPGLFTLNSAAAADIVATDIPDVLDALSPPHGLMSLDVCLGVDNLSLLPVLLSRKGLESLTNLAFGKSSQNTEFTREEEEWFQHLPSLHTLMFCMCERLPSLPSNLTCLTGLKELHIKDCPQVSSLPTLPKSLEYLKIKGCHPELEQRCQEGGTHWDLIRHIPHRVFIN